MDWDALQSNSEQGEFLLTLNSKESNQNATAFPV